MSEALEAKLDALAASFEDFKKTQRVNNSEVRQDIKDIRSRLDDKVVLCRDCILKHQTVDQVFHSHAEDIKEVAEDNRAMRKLMYALIFSILLAISTQFFKIQVGPQLGP